MFAEVMIDQKIDKIIDDWDFLAEHVVPKFTMFRPVGQNIYGNRRRAISTAGTPHRVPHSMGFWHINDMDEIYLPLPNEADEALGHYLVIMQTPTGDEGDGYAWYCERCLTLLFEQRHRTGQFGMNGLFKCSENAVREYNADARLRTCPECGHLNPVGYVWNTAKDTPEERAARAIW